MVLGFLAVVGEAQVQVVLFGESDRGRCAKRNALVSRSKKVRRLAVKMFDKSLGVKFRKAGESLARTEFTRVDEVRCMTAALGHKSAKLESAGFNEKVNEFILLDHISSSLR